MIIALSHCVITRPKCPDVVAQDLWQMYIFFSVKTSNCRRLMDEQTSFPAVFGLEC